MNHSLQRIRLVETGAKLFLERGYMATGVRDVATAAAVPQGSFTNHFRSKERFGCEVLDHYAGQLDAIMDATLRDQTRMPIERLSAYFDTIEALLSEQEWAVGCLIPELAGEAIGHSPLLRARLLEVLDDQTRQFAEALTPIVGGDRAPELAAFVLSAWHGTILRAKVDRNALAIGRFRRMLSRLLEP